MKVLWLIRHAKSSWKDLSLRDFDRPLNDRGIRDAPFMGKQLKERGFMPDIAYASPAKRARSTAHEVFKEIAYPLNNINWLSMIYGAGTTQLLSLLNKENEAISSVCIIGHNPVLTEFSNYLTGEYIDNIPTCGIVEISFKIERWDMVSKGLGSLESFDYPKRHIS